MPTKARFDIAIPVYNEKDNIERNIFALAKALDKADADFRICIIYDFDEDNTLPVIESIRTRVQYPLVLIKNETRGVVNAIRKAFTASDAEFVIISMADLSDDYSVLPQMCRLANEGADIVSASRYMKGGKLHGGPFFKQLLSRLSGVSLHFLTGIPTHDITNSYKLYRRELACSIETESSGGFEIGMEITAKAYLSGKIIKEIPAHWWDRTGGKSKFKLFKWLPKYLKWYFYLIFKKWF